VYVTSYGGGLVDGDALSLDVEVAPRATAFVTTQSFTKAYRAACVRQSVTARVHDGALLAWVPDPVMSFAGASLAQSTRVELGRDGASLVHAEIVAAGRSGERWAFRRLATRLSVLRDGAPVVADAVLLDAAHGSIAARMGTLEAMGTVVAVGPRAAFVREQPRPRLALATAVSPLAADAVLVRVGGRTVEEVVRAVREILGPLLDELGDDPFARKW